MLRRIESSGVRARPGRPTEGMGRVPTTEAVKPAVKSEWSTIEDGELVLRDGELRLKTPAAFISRGVKYMRVRKNPHRAQAPSGEMLHHKGVIYDFFGEDVNQAEGVSVPVPGTLVTDVPDHVHYLRSSLLAPPEEFGTSEYVERGREPDAMRPTLAELAPLIAEATRELEVDKLQVLLEREQATHQRESVLVQLEAAINAVQSIT